MFSSLRSTLVFFSAIGPGERQDIMSKERAEDGHLSVIFAQI